MIYSKQRVVLLENLKRCDCDGLTEVLFSGRLFFQGVMISVKDVYFTLTGTNHYYGSEFMKPGMKVRLFKEPDNSYDREAIRVECKGLGKIGYVANSMHTVIGKSCSAGRLYDKIGKKAVGKVVYVLPDSVLCKLTKAKR